MPRQTSYPTWASIAVGICGNLLLAGCIGGAVDPTNGTFPTEWPRPTVVAILDRGINVYHEAFRGGNVENYIGLPMSHGVDVDTITPQMSGSFEERFRRDEVIWNDIKPDRLYAFSGTNAFGITFEDFPGPSIIEDFSPGHGTATAALVAREAPDVLVVMVSVAHQYCDPSEWTDCWTDSSVSRGMAWAAAQPWIDVISVSAGLLANTPDIEALHPESRAYVEATHVAHESGKILVNAAGNEIAPALVEYHGGPPWIITVGGAESARRGEVVLAGKTPDVVANFTEWAPTAGTIDGYAWMSGTSFGTPIVAGTLANALHKIRVALGHEGGITADGALAVGTLPDGREVRVTNADLRRALNASAEYWSATEYDPTNPTAHNDTYNALLKTSAPIVAGPVQMGWGFVHGGLAEEIARRVLEGDLELPAEKAVAEPWMEAVQAARRAYWG